MKGEKGGKASTNCSNAAPGRASGTEDEMIRGGRGRIRIPKVSAETLGILHRQANPKISSENEDY